MFASCLFDSNKIAKWYSPACRIVECSPSIILCGGVSTLLTFLGDWEIVNHICKSRSTRIELITFIHITEGTDIILTMSYRSGFGSPKPVEMGKEYEVEISEISRRGDGIARIQGFVIFVEGAKSGQKTNIRITSVGDRFAKAQLVWIKRSITRMKVKVFNKSGNIKTTSMCLICCQYLFLILY